MEANRTLENEEGMAIMDDEGVWKARQLERAGGHWRDNSGFCLTTALDETRVVVVCRRTAADQGERAICPF